MRCAECKARRHAECLGDCACSVCDPSLVVPASTYAPVATSVPAPRQVKRPVPRVRDNLRVERPRRVVSASPAAPPGWVDGPTLSDLIGVPLWTLIRWVDTGAIPAGWVTLNRGSGNARYYDPRSVGLLLVQVELFGVARGGGRNDMKALRSRMRSAVSEAWMDPGGRYLHVARDGACRWSDAPDMAFSGWIVDAERIEARVAALRDDDPVPCEA